MIAPVSASAGEVVVAVPAVALAVVEAFDGGASCAPMVAVPARAASGAATLAALASNKARANDIETMLSSPFGGAPLIRLHRLVAWLSES